MIDYHCHLLAGIDDGPTTVADSLVMAQLLVAAGFVEVYCTPHCIRGLYDTTPLLVRERVATFQALLVREGIALRLQPGMEYPLDEFFLKQREDPQPLGDTRIVLVEAPAHAAFTQIQEGISRLIDRGYTPLFAHPERSELFAPPEEENLFSRFLKRISSAKVRAKTPGTLEMLQAMGCLFQGNFGSLAGYYGEKVRMVSHTLLAAGVYSCFGSDGHAPAALERYLGAGMREVLNKNSTFTLSGL